MATTKEKLYARITALESVIRVINQLDGGMTIAFPFESNKFFSKKEKDLIRKEIQTLSFQLETRRANVNKKLGEIN